MTVISIFLNRLILSQAFGTSVWGFNSIIMTEESNSIHVFQLVFIYSFIEARVNWRLVGAIELVGQIL